LGKKRTRSTSAKALLHAADPGIYGKWYGVHTKIRGPMSGYTPNRSYKAIAVGVIGVVIVAFALVFKPAIRKNRVLALTTVAGLCVAQVTVGLNSVDATKATVWASSIAAGTVGGALVDRHEATKQLLPLAIAAAGVWAAAITLFATRGSAQIETSASLAVAASAQTAHLLLSLVGRNAALATATSPPAKKVNANLAF
jgi:hypothetical protein